MSKSSGWIPIDKMLAQEFKEIRRPFSKIEAMFSYTLDVDNGRAGTVSGYSQVWGWSRCKVRNFLKGIQTEEGHIKDRRKTEVRQELDTYPDTTINPNPKEKPPSKVPFEGSKKGKKVYKTKKGKSLSGDRLLSFEKFWESFGYKSGKAEVADAWLEIPSLPNSMVEQICAAATI